MCVKTMNHWKENVSLNSFPTIIKIEKSYMQTTILKPLLLKHRKKSPHKTSFPHIHWSKVM